MTRTWPANEEELRATIRLSITRYGAAGWRWTMLLAKEDSAFSVAVEFRSGEDGRGTWMRMIGDRDWHLVSSPDQRIYSQDEDEARAEIEQVCAAAAVDLVRSVRRRPSMDLARMPPMGTC
ncbi:MAG TPA: hypothetical protein VD978_12915 [Azospirillum sp.]|nr:hypothetical protein [Azospirillum sp.]